MLKARKAGVDAEGMLDIGGVEVELMAEGGHGALHGGGRLGLMVHHGDLPGGFVLEHQIRDAQEPFAAHGDIEFVLHGQMALFSPKPVKFSI